MLWALPWDWLVSLVLGGAAGALVMHRRSRSRLAPLAEQAAELSVQDSPSATQPAWRDAIQGLRRAVDDFRDRVYRETRKWHAETDQLADASSSLFAAADRIGQVAQESAACVDEVTHSAREVNQVVHNVAKQVDSVSEIASQATRTTRNGMESVETASGNISSLRDSIQQVGNLVDAIESIAKKTDLLALNAAIEAANAGEAGQGFAVVADEVRSLADQTSKATEEVSRIVHDLQSQSEESVSSMGTVHERMEEVLARIEETDGTANKIAAAAEELAATMDETTDKVERITQGMEKVNDHVSETEEVALDVGQRAFQLRWELDQFQVSGQSGGVVLPNQAVDFRQAKIDHFAWKARLRGLLNGHQSLDESEAVSHEHCRLGKWIYARGMQDFGHLPAMQELERVHKELHGTIREVIELNNREGPHKAQASYERFEELSGEVVRLLDQLEQEEAAAA